MISLLMARNGRIESLPSYAAACRRVRAKSLVETLIVLNPARAGDALSPGCGAVMGITSFRTIQNDSASRRRPLAGVQIASERARSGTGSSRVSALPRCLRRRGSRPGAASNRAGRGAPCNCRPAVRRSPCRRAAPWRCGSAGRGSLRRRHARRARKIPTRPMQRQEALLPNAQERGGEVSSRRFLEMPNGGPGLFSLDVRGFEDRPPLLDLGGVVGRERLRILILARRNFLAEIGEPLAHAGIG